MSVEDYLVNWYVTLDLMCTPATDYMFAASLYFIGYGVGIIIFTFPDYFGRRGIMIKILPIYYILIVAAAYSNNMFLIKISLFVIGFLHLKNTVSYTQIVEMVADKDKKIAITMINAFDCSNILIVGVFHQYISRSSDKMHTLFFVIGSISCVSYLLIAPESPQWLVLKEGENSQQAIANLNYIAWFNGSSYRIPKNTSLLITHKSILNSS